MKIGSKDFYELKKNLHKAVLYEDNEAKVKELREERTYHRRR